MSLDALYQKLLEGFATSTPATPATPEPDIGQSVANVATVAVADTLNGGDEQTIRAWLAHINETDQGLIEAIIDKCRSSNVARQCYLEQAGKMPKAVLSKDAGRRTVANVATVAVAKLPAWQPAFDSHLNHIMTCRQCRAPKGRYCLEGAKLWEAYNQGIEGNQ